LIELLGRYATGSGKRHALVVDDKAENRELLRRVLEMEDWHVSEARNGREALGEVEREPPSLILLDLMMPVMDGFDFVLAMNKRRAPNQIPIVVVTAKDLSEQDRVRLQGDVAALIERSGLDQDSLIELIREQVSAHPASNQTTDTSAG
jgi:CheY-like chemotaxis protein